MTADRFEVSTPGLRAVAAAFGDRAGDAGKIAERARAADVETTSWGALGLALGLYAGYTAARTSADRSISEVVAFLGDARTALESSARDYDEADRAGGRLFGSIQAKLDGAS